MGNTTSTESPEMETTSYTPAPTTAVNQSEDTPGHDIRKRQRSADNPIAINSCSVVMSKRRRLTTTPGAWTSSDNNISSLQTGRPSRNFLAFLRILQQQLWEETIYSCIPEKQAAQILGSASVQSQSDNGTPDLLENALIPGKAATQPMPAPPTPPDEKKKPCCPFCNSLQFNRHGNDCAIKSLKLIKGRPWRAKPTTEQNLIIPKPPAGQKAMSYRALSGILKGLMKDTSLDLDVSIAPRPIVALAHYLYTQCCHKQQTSTVEQSDPGVSWNWYTPNGFPFRSGEFRCPTPPTPSEFADEEEVVMHPNYAILSGSKIWLLEWNLLLQNETNDTSQRLFCHSCHHGALLCDGWDRLIPLFGDGASKLSWIVSIQYRCNNCQQQTSGTCPYFLAKLPRCLHKHYPSFLGWVQPQGRFQVTRSLSRKISDTIKPESPPMYTIALRMERLGYDLQTQYHAHYAMEEMEFNLQGDSIDGEKEEGFPSFVEWFGRVKIPMGKELESLYQFSNR